MSLFLVAVFVLKFILKLRFPSTRLCTDLSCLLLSREIKKVKETKKHFDKISDELDRYLFYFLLSVFFVFFVFILFTFYLFTNS